MATTPGSTQYYFSRKQTVQHPTSLTYEQQSTECFLDNSIYIFPNPPSSLGSPAQHSDLSVPTDYEFSALSEPNSPVDSGNSSRVFNWSPFTPLTHLERVGLVEWTQSDANDILLGIHDQADQWREVVARQRARESQTSFTGTSLQRIPPAGKIRFSGQQPSSHLPFLSFISSLLSVDDATFQLLYHASSCPTLFPGKTRLSDSGQNNEGDIGLHGVEKLLARESESRVVTGGCAMLSGLSIPYGPFSEFPFVGLWDIMASLMMNGSEAVREVFRSP
ncbi:hypothetical protein BDZ94DRAFT_1236456 [Collybia nuda]|uniref:Uncharacterized protein n=1 Tax=Collybia nuda TaxID=64659 RepID=A0A9P6CI87_9AGAR|nr:hypothetical protein BDZ94DRAFT_1236456 [Collybia nuda]